jgi:hypothetical protein
LSEWKEIENLLIQKKGNEKSKTKVSYYISTKLFDAKTFAEIIKAIVALKIKLIT